MQIKVLTALALFLLFVNYTNAQPFEDLVGIRQSPAIVYHSKGHGGRTQIIADRVEKAIAYYRELLPFRPEVTLLILDSADWKKYSTMGAVYGMPHYDAKRKLLFFAATDNPFWKSFIPPVDGLPATLRNQVESVYRKADGTISMEPFFDLLAIHELGHAFHVQARLNMQRPWMGELFVNILLHSFIAEKEPGSLPALTLFPRMVIGNGSAGLAFTSLKDIEARYEEIVTRHPRNYGWFQCRWHAAAATIYDTGGPLVGQRLWEAYDKQKNAMPDDALLELLDRTEKSVADMVRSWDDR